MHSAYQDDLGGRLLVVDLEISTCKHTGGTITHIWYWALNQGGGFGNATVSLQSASMSRCLIAIVTDFNAPQGSFLSDHCNYRCLKNLCTVNILQRQQSPSFAKSPLNPQKCQNYHKWPKTPKKVNNCKHENWPILPNDNHVHIWIYPKNYQKMCGNGKHCKNA